MSSTLGTAPLSRLFCHVPPSGAWWAEVAVDNAPTPELGAAALTIGDLALQGSVVRVAEDAPGQATAIVRGGPGWWLPLARAESWHSEAGVRLKTVLGALARATGETIVQPADARLGPRFGWAAAGSFAPSTGGMVLDSLVRRGALSTWRVDASGSTRFDAWPATGAADLRVRVTRRELAYGKRVLGLDTAVLALLPGATVEGVVVARLILRETSGNITAEVFES